MRERLDYLFDEFEKAETAEDFGMDNINELLSIAQHLEGHIEWMMTKSKREDVKKIERYEKTLQYYASDLTWRADETGYPDAFKYEGEFAKRTLEGEDCF